MPFITADQILCAVVGDYCLQSEFQAQRKTSSKLVALSHAVTYTLPFLALTQRWEALAFICLTHAVIDHYRLARYVCWLKNFLAPPVTLGVATAGTGGEMNTQYGIIPGEYTETLINDPKNGWRWIVQPRRWWHKWEDCKGTGYHKDSPPWLAVWLMIITDNCTHLACNGLALKLWGE